MRTPVPLRGTSLISALCEISSRVQRTRTVPAILESTGKELATLGMVFGLMERVGDHMHVRHVGGPAALLAALQERYGAPPSSARIPLDAESIWVRVLSQGMTVFNEDMSETAERLFGAVTHEIPGLPLRRPGHMKSILSPLRFEDRLWGFGVFASTSLSAEDIPAIQLFSSHLAGMLDTALAFERLERRNRDLAAVHALAAAQRVERVEQLLPELLRITAEATESDRAAVFLLDAGGEMFRLAGCHGYDGELVAKYGRFPATNTATAASGQALTSRALSIDQWPEATRGDLRAHGFVQMALIPLHIQGRLAGSLNLARTRDVSYSDADLASATLLGEQIAIQLDNVRLFEAERRRVRELSVMNDLGARLSAQEPDLHSVITEALRALTRLVDTQQAFLLLGEPHGQRVRVLASSLEGGYGTGQEFDSSKTLILQKVITEQRVCEVPDVFAADPEKTTISRERGMRALLGVPLVANGRSMGALVLTEIAGPRRFTVDEVSRVRAFANQLSTALANATLFDDLRNSYDRLERAQAELVKRERLAALGELAALVAHEVRNPLAVIFNSVSTLRRLLSPTGDVDLLIRIVEEEADRLNALVGDFLDFARPNEPLLRPGPLEPVLQGAIEAATSARPDSKAVVQLQLGSPVPEFAFDPRLLRQAFVNLVTNALEAMPRGGHVVLRAAREERAGSQMARVDVIDAGPGIPAAVRERLFQPFFTTKASGTGLGLAVVKRIVDAHHGDVDVTSEPGEGTTFTVRLPLGAS